jgi:hypothetical protein
MKQVQFLFDKSVFLRYNADKLKKEVTMDIECNNTDNDNVGILLTAMSDVFKKMELKGGFKPVDISTFIDMLIHELEKRMK